MGEGVGERGKEGGGVRGGWGREKRGGGGGVVVVVVVVVVVRKNRWIMFAAGRTMCERSER